MNKVTVSDLRTKRTKKSIYDAFLALLAEKEISEINIKDIADLAGINRKTFYYHYDSVEELVGEIKKDYARSLLESISHSEEREFKETLRIMFRYSLEQPDNIKKILISDSRNIFSGFSDYIALEKPVPSTADEVYNYMKYRYLTASIDEALKCILEYENLLPREKLIDMAVKMICEEEDFK